MRLLRHAILTCILSTSFAGSASAIPIVFQLDSVVAVGAILPATQTYTPPLPVVGSGDIDFGLGTGFLTLPDYSITVDVLADLVPDAQIDVTGWGQTITSIDGAGNVTSIGAGNAACTNLGGFGAFVCAVVDPNVGGWPEVGGSAVIDTIAQTLTITDPPDPNAGTITTTYSYAIMPVPEPGTALLMGAGLLGLGAVGRRRPARTDPPR